MRNIVLATAILSLSGCVTYYHEHDDPYVYEETHAVEGPSYTAETYYSSEEYYPEDYYVSRDYDDYHTHRGGSSLSISFYPYWSVDHFYLGGYYQPRYAYYGNPWGYHSYFRSRSGYYWPYSARFSYYNVSPGYYYHRPASRWWGYGSGYGSRYGYGRRGGRYGQHHGNRDRNDHNPVPRRGQIALIDHAADDRVRERETMSRGRRGSQPGNNDRERRIITQHGSDGSSVRYERGDTNKRPQSNRQVIPGRQYGSRQGRDGEPAERATGREPQVVRPRTQPASEKVVISQSRKPAFRPNRRPRTEPVRDTRVPARATSRRVESRSEERSGTVRRLEHREAPRVRTDAKRRQETQPSTQRRSSSDRQATSRRSAPVVREERAPRPSRERSSQQRQKEASPPPRKEQRAAPPPKKESRSERRESRRSGDRKPD